MKTVRKTSYWSYFSLDLMAMEGTDKMQKTGEASDNISGAPAPGGDHGPLTHEKVNTQSTRNIKMRQHLCVVHALPRTRLTNAILYENSSQERHLEMKLTGNQDRLKTKFSSLVAFTGLICSYFINFCLGLVVLFYFGSCCFALDVLDVFLSSLAILRAATQEAALVGCHGDHKASLHGAAGPQEAEVAARGSGEDLQHEPAGLHGARSEGDERHRRGSGAGG